jgi:hypothetical protein
MLRFYSILCLLGLLVGMSAAADDGVRDNFELVRAGCVYKNVNKTPSDYYDAVFGINRFAMTIEIKYFYQGDYRGGFVARCYNNEARHCEGPDFRDERYSREYLSVRSDGKIFTWHVYDDKENPYVVTNLYELAYCP